MCLCPLKLHIIKKKALALAAERGNAISRKKHLSGLANFVPSDLHWFIVTLTALGTVCDSWYRYKLADCQIFSLTFLLFMMWLQVAKGKQDSITPFSNSSHLEGDYPYIYAGFRLVIFYWVLLWIHRATLKLNSKCMQSKMLRK